VRRRAEDIAFALHHLENLGEFLLDDEKALIPFTVVVDQILIVKPFPLGLLDGFFCNPGVANIEDQAFTGGEARRHTLGGPVRVNLGQDITRSGPCGALSALGRLPDLHDEETAWVLRRFNSEMGLVAHDIPDGSQQVDQNRGFVTLGVGFNGLNDLPTEAVEGIGMKLRPRRCGIAPTSTLFHVSRGFRFLRGGEVSNDPPDILRIVRGSALGGKPLEHCLDLVRVPAEPKVVAGDLGGDLVPLTLGDPA
jgi:hypothetical protein